MSKKKDKNTKPGAVPEETVSAGPSLAGYVRQLADVTPDYVSSMFGASVFETARSVAESIDEALSELVDTPLAEVYEANRERAMDNPIYRDIEERRTAGEGRHAKVFLSDELDLGLDEVRLQDEILDEVREDPWWFDIAQTLNQSPTQRAVTTVWGWYQRAARGWSDSDAWNLDVHLSKTLGDQLNYLADIAHGWPASEEYPTMESWTNALRENAALLLAYVDDKVGEWTGEDDGLTFKERLAREDDLAAGAKRAYLWIGANFQALWD